MLLNEERLACVILLLASRSSPAKSEAICVWNERGVWRALLDAAATAAAAAKCEKVRPPEGRVVARPAALLLEQELEELEELEEAEPPHEGRKWLKRGLTSSWSTLATGVAGFGRANTLWLLTFTFRKNIIILLFQQDPSSS